MPDTPEMMWGFGGCGTIGGRLSLHGLFTGQSLARYAESQLNCAKVNFEVWKIPCSVGHIRETMRSPYPTLESNTSINPTEIVTMLSSPASKSNNRYHQSQIVAKTFRHSTVPYRIITRVVHP